MKVIVKKMHGRACVIDTSPTETVLQLKQKVDDQLGVDVAQQKLLLVGKALADEKPLSFYPGIKDGSVLNLVIKQVKEPDSAAFRSELTRVLKHYYSESTTDLIIDHLIKELTVIVNELSYDDLERVATTLMMEEENVA